ncbi:MAG: hypothetical protein AABY18_04805 [Candidatus Thermoplasmatota archaeon]
MRAWSFPPTLTFLVAVLASGCTSPDESQDQGTVVTDPSDYSYLNTTGASAPHIHDYWSGEDRLKVLDQERPWTFTVNGGGFGSTTFHPDDGSVIPQGTASVETTVSWTDRSPGMYGDLELWIKTQADSEPRFVATLASGEPVVFATNLADADLPHQVLSAWDFTLHILSPDGQPSQPLTNQVRSYDLDVTIQAEAVRGLDLPAFPGHPDFWNGSTELPLVGDASGTTLFWGQEPPACGYCSGGINIVDPDNGTRVPNDATVVEVTMRYAHDTPTGLRLLYHGADTRDWKDAPIDSDDGETRVHRIPVNGDGDGPYSDQSLWEFYFGFEGGVGPYKGSWELTARVLKDG